MVMDWLSRYWGFVALVAAIACWAGAIAGTTAAIALVVFILLLSAGAVAYFLFRVPVWCRAVTRGRAPCRNNSRGLLLGCELRQHKWQRLAMLVRAGTWRELAGRLWSGTADKAGTLGVVGAGVSGLAAIIVILVR